MNKLATTITIFAAIGLAAGSAQAQAGGGPHVRVLNGNVGTSSAGLLLPAVQSARETARRSGSATHGGFTGGVYVATGDVNDDGMARGGANFAMGDGSVRGVRSGGRSGTPDVITSAGPGAGPHIRR